MSVSNVLVFAIHPDDETLCCGGTLLKHKERGDRIHWLIATHLFEDQGYSSETIEKRNKLNAADKFFHVHSFDYHKLS